MISAKNYNLLPDVKVLQNICKAISVLDAIICPHIFDGNPQTYIDWATGYFEDGCKTSGIPLETVTWIYNGEVLTKEMVLTIVEEPGDWEQLKDLTEADYPYSFD